MVYLTCEGALGLSIQSLMVIHFMFYGRNIFDPFRRQFLSPYLFFIESFGVGFHLCLYFFCIGQGDWPVLVGFKLSTNPSLCLLQKLPPIPSSATCVLLAAIFVESNRQSGTRFGLLLFLKSNPLLFMNCGSEHFYNLYLCKPIVVFIRHFFS